MSGATDQRFEALEYRDDGSVAPARFRYTPAGDGWEIARNDQEWLSLGAGYQLLKTAECGVCSTDLDRRHLPFPLPQVIGHELIALDEGGARHVVEINASCEARQLSAPCVFCRRGLQTHCPERLVLGIHDLPGGFGGWVLAPRGAVIPVPDQLPSRTAVLVEPFAAALRAVDTVAPRDGEVIAVLGPRRLGMLVIAALAAVRHGDGPRFEVAAMARRAALLELASGLGADHLIDVSAGATVRPRQADVVVDTTGHPDGLTTAVLAARREVHLKSTHGQPAGGISRATEMVVDELALERFDPDTPPADLGLADSASPPRVAWLASSAPPEQLTTAATILRGDDAAAALERIEQGTPPGDLPRADAAVVDAAEQIDDVVRPSPRRETSLVRPRGRILVHDSEAARRSPALLVREVARRGLRVSTSRCGDFLAALDLMARTPSLHQLGAQLVTHQFNAEDLAAALETARSDACIKAVVTHRA